MSIDRRLSTVPNDPRRAPTDRARGWELLYHPDVNKGTAFTADERAAGGLEGLLPPRVHSLGTQVSQAMETFRQKPTDLEKHIFLMALQDRNERLFFKTMMDHIDVLLPIIYTPTVGEASQRYSHIFRRPRGLYITIEHKGRIEEILRNWPQSDVRIIVVTDGERILGLGDLGVNGMGIPIGKLVLYTAGAGIDPSWTLPIVLDVGTNNEELLSDPLYLGLPRRRVVGDAYDEFVDEFMTATQRVFPHVLVQFEDFANHHAIPLLKRYRERFLTFNDDMQGTAAVTLAGLLASNRITDRRLTDETMLFVGAGTAGTGIADLTVAAMVERGLTVEQARERCWFFDRKGLVVKTRRDLAEHNLPYAHDHPLLVDLGDAVDTLRPTVLIGVSGQPGLFTKQIVEAMAEFNERPIIFPLSNPTSHAESTAEQAYVWTGGRVIFASGSPFGPVQYDGRTFVPGQGNNAYVFPGIGLGVVAAGARRVTDEMFLAAAETLAATVTSQALAEGTLYPDLRQLCSVSQEIAKAVAQVAYERQLATVPEPANLAEHIESIRYRPDY